MKRHRSSDDTALAQIWRDAWASANPDISTVAPLEHWVERVRLELGPPNLVLAHRHDGHLVAFGVLDVNDAHLHQLHVSPSAQGRGIGGRLIGRVKELCPTGWALHVAVSNERAQRFYVRHGLTAGRTTSNPVTGRERILYSWRP